MNTTHTKHIEQRRIGQKAFTLIEVLVVISIIGLLSVVVMIAIRSARTQASLTRLQADAKSILTQVNLVRTTDLISYTGNSCTMCFFDTVNKVNSQSAMIVQLNNSWTAIGFAASPMDPYGSPYLLDENEDQFPGDPCQYDTVYSAGTNGIWEGWGTYDPDTLVPGIPVQTGAGDDYVFALDFGKSCSAPGT